MVATEAGEGGVMVAADSQGFDLADARVMIASALEEMAQMLLEEGRALPVPDPDASASDADLVELIPVSVEVGRI